MSRKPDNAVPYINRKWRIAMRKLGVDAYEAMVRSLGESVKRQRKILEESESKLQVAQEMLEQARKESAQTDLVGQAATPAGATARNK